MTATCCFCFWCRCAVFAAFVPVDDVAAAASIGAAVVVVVADVAIFSC